MDEVKDKMKGLMKKVNHSFSSSSSGKFKGHGRVLGSSSSSSSSPASSPLTLRPLPQNTKPSAQNSKPSPAKVSNAIPEEKSTSKSTKANPIRNGELETSFDPYNPLITSGERNPNGYSLKGFECPVCSKYYSSEEEVSVHVESCLNNADSGDLNRDIESNDGRNQLEDCVSLYLSGKPSDSSIDVVMKLLGNVIREPENAKFRKVRIGNPKIKEAIGDISGGIELLECVGFELGEENGEMWLVMDNASVEKIGLVKKVVALLDQRNVGDLPCNVSVEVKENEERSDVSPAKAEECVETKNIDRQVRVFFSVPESVAAKIELPDSFYKISAEEVKREAEARRKKLDESKLLIPKSYKEKQAKAARKQYQRTVIRIQFPDGVVLQAIFRPSESTGSLYEFVSSSLKQQGLEFELLHPIPIKRRVIPHSPNKGERAKTLEDEDLVPAALIKFRPIETEDIVFTGICNELLEISEPLVSDTAVPIF